MKKVFLMLVMSVRATVWVQAQTVVDTLHWSAARPLQAADFKMGPQTYTGLSGEAFCMLGVNFSKAHAFAKPVFITTAQFDRGKSWLDTTANVKEPLAYFQVMFDLYELHARRLKKDLEENAPGGDPTAFMNERYSAAMGALTTEFADFRKSARMGRDTAVVKQWSERVRKDIEALAAFARQ